MDHIPTRGSPHSLWRSAEFGFISLQELRHLRGGIRRNPGMGSKDNVVAVLWSERLEEAGIIIRVAANNRLRDSGFAHRTNDQRQIWHVGRNIEEIRLLRQGLDAGKLGREICRALSVGLFE